MNPKLLSEAGRMLAETIAFMMSHHVSESAIADMGEQLSEFLDDLCYEFPIEKHELLEYITEHYNLEAEVKV